MKKITAIITGIILVAGLMAGCTKNPKQTQQTKNDTKQPQMAQEINDVKNDAVQDLTVSDSNNKSETNHKPSVDTSNFIGEDKAKEIALKQAGLAESEVKFDRVELDEDDSVWHYEVEFNKGTTEYDADVKADDGTLLKWEIDND